LALETELFQWSHDFKIMDSRHNGGHENHNQGFNGATILKSWIEKDGEYSSSSLWVSMEPRF